MAAETRETEYRVVIDNDVDDEGTDTFTSLANAKLYVKHMRSYDHTAVLQSREIITTVTDWS